MCVCVRVTRFPLLALAPESSARITGSILARPEKPRHRACVCARVCSGQASRKRGRSIQGQPASQPASQPRTDPASPLREGRALTG